MLPAGSCKKNSCMFALSRPLSANAQPISHDGTCVTKLGRIFLLHPVCLTSIIASSDLTNEMNQNPLSNMHPNIKIYRARLKDGPPGWITMTSCLVMLKTAH